MEMKRMIAAAAFLLLASVCPAAGKGAGAERFPDGKPISEWYYQTEKVDMDKLGKRYVVTHYGVLNDGKVHTEEFQALIDKVAQEGGGVIVVPAGVYHSGALFFRQGTHLHIERGGILMGSDDIADYPLMETRIEGETCMYFPGLVNADGLDGFTISGEGSIDGNGFRAWQAFWLRRAWNPSCTNKDEQRPRLIYISNSKNVTICDVQMQNTAFWNTHFYNCSRVKCLDVRFESPHEPVKAPSSDGIDLDVCSEVLVKGCYFNVNDDALCLKGGRGPWADDPERSVGNGGNYDILVEDCTYGFCHSCLTCGSESVHNRNILFRRIKVEGRPLNLFRLKMRPDTPQLYEYITLEDVSGSAVNFILIDPWTRFYDIGDRKDIPMSYADNIVMRNMKVDCDRFFNVKRQDDQYKLSNFTFENLDITAGDASCDRSIIKGFRMKNVKVTENE